jgi:hypothetical protein
MEKVINNGAAEKSSKIEGDKKRWYLSIFGKIGLGALNGSGVTHNPVSSLVNSEFIIVMNLRSSYDVPTSSSH